MEVKQSIQKATSSLIIALSSLMVMNAQDDFFWQEFVKDEATYQSQTIQLPRASYDKPLTLRQQLESVVGQFNYTKGALVQSYMGGIESRVYENVDELLDSDPVMLSFDKGEDQLKRKQFEMNTSIYLYYKDPYGKDCCLVVHTRPRGFLNKAIYTRTSIMLPSQREADDFRTFSSKSAPIAISYLTAFDVVDMTKDIAEFERIKESAIKNYNEERELSDIEEKCIIGLREQDELWNNKSYGYHLYDNKRYYDAFVTLEPLYDYLKSYIRPDYTDMNDIFYETSHKMGMSMWKLGFNETAAYYLSVASFGDEKYRGDYNEFIKSTQGRNRIHIDERSDSKVTVRDFLSIILDADYGNLREGIANINGKIQKLATREDVYEYDIKNLCTETASNLTLTYTRTGYEREEKDYEDDSKLFFENNIIFSSVQVDKNRWRINVLVPNFKTRDFKKGDDEFNIPYTASFIVGTNETGELIKKASKSYSSLVDRYNVIAPLSDEGRFLESVIHLQQIEADICSLPEKERSDKKMAELESNILFDKGFLLQELVVTPKAAATLAESIRIQGDTHKMQEYISILSNIVDPRVFEIIKTELQENHKDKSYYNFLNRRYSFMLIEYGMIDEAEVILKRLLDDPDSETFARNELEYIKSLRKK